MKKTTKKTLPGGAATTKAVAKKRPGQMVGGKTAEAVSNPRAKYGGQMTGGKKYPGVERTSLKRKPQTGMKKRTAR